MGKLKQFIASILIALIVAQAPLSLQASGEEAQQRVVITPTTDIEPIVEDLISQAQKLKAQGKQVEIEAVYIHGQTRAPELAEVLAHFKEAEIDVALMEVTPEHFDRLIERTENSEVKEEELTHLLVEFSAAAGKGWTASEIQDEIAKGRWKKMRLEFATRLKRMKARLFGLPKGSFFLKKSVAVTGEAKRDWKKITKPIIEKNPQTGKYQFNLPNTYDWMNALWMAGASGLVYSWAATGFGTEVQTWNVIAASALFSVYEFLVTLYQKPFTAYSDRGIAVEVRPADRDSRTNEAKVTYRPKLAYTYTLNIMIEVALAYTAAALNAMTFSISDAPFTLSYGVACATASIPMFEALDTLYKKADQARAAGDTRREKLFNWGARATSFLYFSVIYVTLDHVFVGAGQESAWAMVPFATLGGAGLFAQLWLRKDAIVQKWKSFREKKSPTEQRASGLSTPRCQMLFRLNEIRGLR